MTKLTSHESQRLGLALILVAAAIGAIAGAVIVIGQRSITDLATAALALVTVAVLWRFKKLPEPFVVVAAALIGLFLFPLVAPA